VTGSPTACWCSHAHRDARSRLVEYAAGAEPDGDAVVDQIGRRFGGGTFLPLGVHDASPYRCNPTYCCMETGQSKAASRKAVEQCVSPLPGCGALSRLAADTVQVTRGCLMVGDASKRRIGRLIQLMHRRRQQLTSRVVKFIGRVGFM
jgi:hypothetical protein